MNEIQELEKRLAGWTPRRPSRPIEQSIFESSSPRESDESDSLTWLGLWQRLLGPMGAFGLVLLVSLSTVSGIATSRAGAVGLSDVWEYKPVYHHSTLNHCDYPIFGWTNLSLPDEGIALFAADQKSRIH